MRTSCMLWGNVKREPSHPPVAIATGSAAFASIDENQVLTITPINIASGITYFLHEEIDTPTGYESALTIPAEDAQDADAITVNASEGEKLIDTYITAVGDPNTTVIPSGAWKFTTYTQVGTVIGVTEMVIRVYKRTIADAETELFNTSFVIDSTTVKQYDKLSVQQEINLALTDRLVFKYYAKTTSVPNRTVTLYYEGTDHYSHIDTPIKALSMHNPVTIAAGSAGRGSIDENQVLTINEQTFTQILPTEVTGITLTQANWTLVSSFYEYDLANANITATSEVEVIFMKSTIAIVKAADIMPDNLSDTGTVKIYATNEPTSDISVTLIITEVAV